MLNLLKRYTPPVLSFQVELYEHESPILRFKATVAFTNGSRLRIKEYRFSDGSRKYAYHWETADGSLLARWDNAEHWPQIATFPHHKHLGTDNEVEASTETDLESVLKHIAVSRKLPSHRAR